MASNPEKRNLNAKLDYYRYAYAAQCFHLAKVALDLLEQHYDEPYLHEVFMCAFVVYATQPFKQNQRTPRNLKINRKNGIVDVEFGGYANVAGILHKRLIVLRDKVYAHSDLDIGDGEAENKCLVESVFDEEGILLVNPIFTKASIRKEEIVGYKCMLEQQYNLFNKKSNSTLEPHIQELVEAGFYELVLDDEERWFAPVSDLGD